MRRPPPLDLRALRLAAGAVLLLACCGRAASCGAHPPSAPAPSCAAKALTATRAARAPTPDGKLDEPDWVRAGSTGAFVDATGAGALVAHTEARVLWDDAGLYLALYAADEDIGDDDHLDVTLAGADGGVFTWELPPNGKVRCRLGKGACGPMAGVTGAADSDGTLNDSSDDDEEWTAEVAIPWAALGASAPPARLAINFGRTDRPKGHPQRRLAWSLPCGADALGVVVLDPAR